MIGLLVYPNLSTIWRAVSAKAPMGSERPSSIRRTEPSAERMSGGGCPALASRMLVRDGETIA